MKKSGIWIFIGCLFATGAAHASAAEVLESSGAAVVRKASGDVPAAAGTLVADGETVETSEGATVDLAFDGDWNNTVRVEPSTTARLEQANPARLDLENGGLYVMLKNLPSGSDFEVRTPTAVASVRGTEFRTTFDGQQASILNFSDSIVQVFAVTRGVRASAPRVLTNAKKLVLAGNETAPSPLPLTDIETREGAELAQGIAAAVEKAVAEGRVSKIPAAEEPVEPQAEEAEPEESGEKIADDGKEWETLVVGEFSADVVLTSSQGRFSYRFYAGAERSRMEMGDNVSIVRLDRGLTYVLIPAQNSFIEQPLTSEAAAQAAGSEGSILSRKELGREPLNGKDAVKYEVVLSAGGNRQTVYQWMSDDSPVPLRMQAVDGSWSVEYQNVVVGPQPAALFEVPGGFQRMQMETALPQDASEVAAFQEAGERKLKEDLEREEREKEV